MALTEAQKRAHKKYASKTNHRLRVLLLVEFGPCTRCGFSDARALQFDHVAGGGTADRVGRIPMHPGLYNKTRERFIRGELQILCANCNWIKRYENKEVGENVWHSTTAK